MADVIRAGELKRQAINETGPGPATIVAALTGYRVAVVGFLLSADAADMVTWQDNATTLCDVYIGQDAPFAAPQMDPAWFVTRAGDPLVMAITGAATVAGVLVYRYVPEFQRF